MKLILYPENTQTATLPDVVDGKTGAAITGATITATLYDRNGKVVTGADALEMSEVEGEAGSYEVTFPSSFSRTSAPQYSSSGVPPSAGQCIW